MRQDSSGILPAWILPAWILPAWIRPAWIRPGGDARGVSLLTT